MKATNRPTTLVIGGTGWIGQNILRALARHTMPAAGSTRSARGAESIRAVNAEPRVIDLADLGQLAGALDGIERVVYAASPAADTGRAVLSFLAQKLPAEGRLLYISGSSIYGGGTDATGRPATEDEAPTPSSPAWLAEQEQLVLTAPHGTVVRAAGLLWGQGRGSTPTFLFEDAIQRQAAWVIGAGEQQWSALHVIDLAELVVTLLESPAAGGIYNAAAESVSVRDIASRIAQQAQVNVVSVSAEEADAAWSWWAQLLSRPLVIDASRALHTGWVPTQERFLDSSSSLPGGER